jgi:hypothetical protein
MQQAKRIRFVRMYPSDLQSRCASVADLRTFGPPEYFELQYGGRKFKAEYRMSERRVHVSSSWGNKFAIESGGPPQVVARLVFREILDDAKRRGEL